MVRVLVVGGGTAGIEAAAEAVKDGAEVTLFERREEYEPPWESWVDLVRPSICPTHRNEGPPPVLCAFIGREVRSVERDVVRTAEGDSYTFDSVVLATGSRFEQALFQGSRKPGVMILDGIGKYSELGQRSPSIERAIVYGEGERTLQVAERLSGDGRKVTAVVSGWRCGRPSPPVEAVIRESARDAGVILREGKIQRALGVGTLEAAALDGDVVLCDTLAVVPRRVPHLPSVEASLGRGGGVLVTSQLRSSNPTILSAGGSAELATGVPPFSSLCGEELISGRISGANATGQWHQVQSARFAEVVLFGLRWSRSGVWTKSGRTPSIEDLSQRKGLSACSIAYDVRRGDVVGIETIAGIHERAGDIRFAVSQGATLQSIAYGSSIDITLVSETARLGMRWSRS